MMQKEVNKSGKRQETNRNGVINHQIEIAQEEVIKAKQKYDVATDHLKKLLDKKKELQTEELMEAVMKSKHSYDEILRYVKSDIEEK